MSLPRGRLSFKVEIEKHPESLTSYAGLPLVIEAARSVGLVESAARHLRQPTRPNGYPAETLVEMTLAAISVGAKSPEDVARLGQDRGFRRLVGLSRFPSADTILRFLNAAHELPDWRAGVEGKAILPPESGRLQGLAQVNREAVAAAQASLKFKQATLDLDATLIKSAKREALRTYEGYRGYQPWVAVWAEANLVVADQFREGNVPACFDALSQFQATLAGLPPGIEQLFVRADSALYDQKAMRWMDRREGCEHITFAISADMSPELRAACMATPDSQWKPLMKPSEYGPIPTDDELAEIDFVPEEPGRKKTDLPLRFIAIRKKGEQQTLFGGTDGLFYLAIATNLRDAGPEHVWNWHREKCGTIEHVHDVLKNELAAGVMPCGRFQANAAWFRLNILAYNLLSMLKSLGLPQRMGALRPASLRFHLLNVAGRIIEHGRRLVLRLPFAQGFVTLYEACRDRLWALAKTRAAPSPT